MLAPDELREVTVKLKNEAIFAALALEELELCRLSLYGGRNAYGNACSLP